MRAAGPGSPGWDGPAPLPAPGLWLPPCPPSRPCSAARLAAPTPRPPATIAARRVGFLSLAIATISMRRCRPARQAQIRATLLRGEHQSLFSDPLSRLRERVRERAGLARGAVRRRTTLARFAPSLTLP